MTEKLVERSLERLNYYNGQRLEASDLKLEQDYHIRVRRWLNRSLYSAGIARGLEVREIKGTRTVVISPGLALDAEGREIILLEEVEEIVPGRGRHRLGTGSAAEVEGLYLTIRYDEQVVAEERGVCFARAAGDDSGRSRPASGGPARINATPVFNWRVFLPHESSGEIVLAQVELDKDCTKVHQVDASVRRYVGAASAAKVQQFAIEGEREVAYIPTLAANDQPVARIYFHIRGRQPNAVTLYLRAAKFSPLHYTEMGQHDHDIGVNVNSLTLPAHSHALPPDTGVATSHGHTISSITADTDDSVWPSLIGVLGTIGYPNPVYYTALTAFFAAAVVDTRKVLTLSPRPFHNHDGDNLATRVAMNITVDPEPDPKHTHPLPAFTLPGGSIANAPLSGAGTAANAGVSDVKARSSDHAANTPQEKALTYVDGLQIWIGRNKDAVNHTVNILEQLADANSTGWPAGTKLGSGSENHVLVVDGTGPIRLDFLPDVYFTEGEHYIELRVPPKTGNKPNGGRVLYNLYVE